MPRVLECAIGLARDLGATTAIMPMPGHCRNGIAYLLERGFKLGSTVNLLQASRPFGHPDRYIHSGGDALF